MDGWRERTGCPGEWVGEQSWLVETQEEKKAERIEVDVAHKAAKPRQNFDADYDNLLSAYETGNICRGWIGYLCACLVSCRSEAQIVL